MICSVANAALKAPWILNCADWMEIAPLPFDSGSVRTLIVREVDKAVVLNGEELLSWARAAYGKSKSQQVYQLPEWQESISRDLSQIEMRVGEMGLDDLYVAWWYYWETGLD